MQREVVHAYSDGTSPGMQRSERLGLKAVKFPLWVLVNAALILAYEKNAELIVTVGSHNND